MSGRRRLPILLNMDKDKDGALARRGGEDIAAFVEAARNAPAPAQSGRWTADLLLMSGAVGRTLSRSAER